MLFEVEMKVVVGTATVLVEAETPEEASSTAIRVTQVREHCDVAKMFGVYRLNLNEIEVAAAHQYAWHPVYSPLVYGKQEVWSQEYIRKFEE
jgi:hypothetical protein